MARPSRQCQLAECGSEAPKPQNPQSGTPAQIMAKYAAFVVFAVTLPRTAILGKYLSQ